MKVIIYQLIAIGILSIFITMQLVKLPSIDDLRKFKNSVSFSLNQSSNNTENAMKINSETKYSKDRKKYCYFYNFTVAEGLKYVFDIS